MATLFFCKDCANTGRTMALTLALTRGTLTTVRHLELCHSCDESVRTGYYMRVTPA